MEKNKRVKIEFSLDYEEISDAKLDCESFHLDSGHDYINDGVSTSKLSSKELCELNINLGSGQVDPNAVQLRSTELKRKQRLTNISSSYCPGLGTMQVGLSEESGKSNGAEEIKKLISEPIILSYNSCYFGVKRVDIPGTLRPIVIDGSNVAMGHGNNNCYSCLGISYCVRFFCARGHTEISVMVPQYRQKRNNSVDTHVLDELKKGILIFTPSREVGRRRFIPYDDRYIVQYAYETGAVIVSNDSFKDLYDENPMWRDTITNRVLPFTWINKNYYVPTRSFRAKRSNSGQVPAVLARTETVNYVDTCRSSTVDIKMRKR